MGATATVDSIIIGYNESPFEQYEQLIRQYGEDSEAYRDLKFSFVPLGEKKLTYVDLMNHVYRLAHKGKDPEPFRSGDIPNLGAVYLSNYLRRHGHESKYINLFQYEKEQLAAYLAQDPCIVAITTTFYVLNFPVIEMVDFIRRHNKKVKIVVGGPLIANHARNYQGKEFKAALRDIGADVYVIESQGESTLEQIVSCLKRDGDLSEVPNIIWDDHAEFRVNLVLPESNSLDEHYIDWTAFGGSMGATIQTRTARSCAYSCSFCNYPTRAGKLTLAGLDTVAKELDSMRALGTVKNVVFIDDTFNVPLPRFKDMCRMMIEKKYNFHWFSYFRCAQSDDEAIELMARSGCKGVFLGIESGSPTILRNMHKVASVDQYARGIELLKQHGILTFGSFITGFPGETEETVRETATFIRETKLDYYRTQMWYCEKGTPIFNEREKYQINGEGFVWSHATMDSMEAMDHIERLFLTVKDSAWLPQWSFDFWIIPYLLGKGLTMEQFRRFMDQANQMHALGIATLPEAEQRIRAQAHLREMVEMAAAWSLS